MLCEDSTDGDGSRDCAETVPHVGVGHTRLAGHDRRKSFAKRKYKMTNVLGVFEMFEN